MLGDGEVPLRNVRYAPAATVLWRWVRAPEDGVVERFLVHCRQADPDRLAALRSAVSMEGMHTLVWYARRATLAALRTADVTRVLDGWSALSMIDLGRHVDPRDVWTAAWLVRYAADRLGCDLAAVADAAVAPADTWTVDVLGEVLDEPTADLLECCGMREVPTADGLVLVEDDEAPYRAESDLVGAALGVIDVLAAAGYADADVIVGPSRFRSWLGHQDDAGLNAVVARMPGCACVQAFADGAEHMALVFLVELADERDAALLAAAADRAADDATPMVGHAVGRHCAITIGSSTTGPARLGWATLLPIGRRAAGILRATVTR